MTSRSRSRGLRLLIACALLSVGAAGDAGTARAAAAPADQPAVVDGTITAVNGTSLTIAPTGGPQRTVRVDPDTLILRRDAATFDSIRPGDAMGVAAKRGADGSLTAASINIFAPALWSRVRKGQWTMESGDIMTNAVVFKLADRGEGRILYLKYADGSAAILVPGAAQIHRLTLVGLGDLRPGMRVTARGSSDPDGTIKARSITLEHG